jgi:phosphoglycolate phosphatase
MRNKYQLLVFDWDGTLMDSMSEIVHCFQSAAADLQMDVPTPAQIHAIIGVGMHEAIGMLFPELTTAEVRQPLIERYRHYYFHPEKRLSELYPGVKEMLLSLEEKGFLLGVATSKGRRGLDAVLARTGLDRVFHATRCIDEAQSKPHPQMLLDVLTLTGVDKHEALMIGDTEFDLLMAQNAGVKSIGVSCGAHPRERLVSCKPLVCLDHTAEVLLWLEKHSF